MGAPRGPGLPAGRPRLGSAAGSGIVHLRARLSRWGARSFSQGDRRWVYQPPDHKSANFSVALNNAATEA